VAPRYGVDGGTADATVAAATPLEPQTPLDTPQQHIRTAKVVLRTPVPPLPLSPTVLSPTTATSPSPAST
jgi:hypothetical protein